MPVAGEAIHVRLSKSGKLIIVRPRCKTSRRKAERRSCDINLELNFQLAGVGEKTRSDGTAGRPLASLLHYCNNLYVHFRVSYGIILPSPVQDGDFC